MLSDGNKRHNTNESEGKWIFLFSYLILYMREVMKEYFAYVNKWHSWDGVWDEMWKYFTLMGIFLW